MEAARIERQIPDWRHAALILVLLALAGLAWAVTDERMQGMDGGPGTDPGSLGFYTTAWIVMMAAMMFPSIAPMVRTYALVQRRRTALGHAHGPAALPAFVLGYLGTWLLFGLAAYALFALAQSLSPGFLDWDRAGRYVAAGVIAAAALYQLTPAKNACLTRCRGPLDFLLERWRDGTAGAARIGAEHGAWCVGCCWGLMVALFALGVMSVGWMVLVAGLIAAEKLLPWQPLPSRFVAAVLVVLAIAVAAVPRDVPGLTIPGEGHGMMMSEPGGETMERDRRDVKPRAPGMH